MSEGWVHMESWELERQLAEARAQAADLQMLAFQWMRCYDMIVAGVDPTTINKPKPTDLPDAIREARAQGMREAAAIVRREGGSGSGGLATIIERAAQTPPASQDGVAPAKCPKCGGKLCQPYKSTDTGLWTQRCDKCAYFDSWAGIEPRAGRDLEGK